MVILDSYSNQITDFIQTSIDRFKSEHGSPSSIGIYCCPWAGWITINFNLSKTIEETYENCPDFEVVEYELLELDAWQNEYHEKSPTFKIGENVIIHDHGQGDEKLNKLFFNFLEPIVINVKQQQRISILLQMLDSKVVKVL